VDRPIIGIQQTPRDGEDEPASIRDMARNYADRIQEVDPTGPYHLLGWSFGGVVAHEIAVELQRRGCSIAHLVLLDALLVIPDAETLNHDVLVEKQLEEVLLFYGIDIPDEDEPLTYERAEELFREKGFVEFARYKPLLALIVKNNDTNMPLARGHEPSVFTGDVHIFAATGDDDDQGSTVVQSWRPYINGDIMEHLVDCKHAAMMTTESLSLYGQRLRGLLEAEDARID
jgi:thioesterase domain-containing protein